MKHHILVVEDEAIIRSSLKRLLERNGYLVSEAASVHQAAESFRLPEFDLVITDLRLPGEPGTTLIDMAKPAPVLIMTSFGTLKSAVDAMKQGAVDYISKPFDHDEMLLSVSRILREQKLSTENAALRQTVAAPESGIIGSSTPMQELFRRISKVAPMSSTVLVRGESGTGKPLEAQARLLRLLQEKEVRRLGATQTRTVDIRLVAATHRNLKQLAAEGRFREDLYYRLNVVELTLPPLRERGHDIIEIAEFLLAKTCERLNVKRLRFHAATAHAMLAYKWPGNVRELENAIERAVILADDDEITPDLLAIEVDVPMLDESAAVTPGSPASAHAPAVNVNEVPDPPAGLSLEDYFQSFVLAHQEQMSETELARKLGISRKSLWERRQRLGIPRRRSTSTPDSDN